MRSLPKHGSEAPRDRILADAELIQVWQAAGAIGWPFGPVYQLLILTGARLWEIGELKWSEIDGNQIKLDGERTKAGLSHTIPLSSRAAIPKNTAATRGPGDDRALLGNGDNRRRS